MRTAASLLASGSVLALVTAAISRSGFVSPSAQWLPYAKFLTILVYSWIYRGITGDRRLPLSRKGSRDVYMIGFLSVIAYCFFCVGFSFAGTGLAVSLHSASGQTFTAILSRLILKRKLTWTKLSAVAIVNLGLLLRGLAPGSKQAPGDTSTMLSLETLGSLAIMASSVCYAFLGIVFDSMLKTEKPAPSALQTMEVEGWIGAAALTVWQLVYVLPSWESLVAMPMRRSGVSSLTASSELVLSGLVFIWHYYNMTNMFATDGAVAVGLVNAVRGAVVALIAGHIYCTPQTPGQCNSFWTVCSALVVCFGAILWVAPLGSTTSGRKQKIDQEVKDR